MECAANTNKVRKLAKNHPTETPRLTDVPLEQARKGLPGAAGALRIPSGDVL